MPLPSLSCLCSLPHSGLFFFFARVCLAGGARPHEKEMQVPRDVRQLPAEDLLAGHAGVPAGGVDSQGALPHRHAHQGPQPEHRTAGPLAPQQPQQPPQPSQPPPPSEQPPPPPHAPAAAEHQRTRVL